MDERFYIDCEFDGHNGPLLSMAIVAESDGFGMHMQTYVNPHDPWVAENVMPHMATHKAHIAWVGDENEFGEHLLYIMKGTKNPVVIADSVVDIARFCRAISTNADGGWESIPGNISFEVHDIACYPTTLEGAVQHNAWWDAMALREKLKGEER